MCFIDFVAEMLPTFSYIKAIDENIRGHSVVADCILLSWEQLSRIMTSSPVVRDYDVTPVAKDHDPDNVHSQRSLCHA